MESTFSEDEISDSNMEEFSSSNAEDTPPISPTWPTVSDVHRALRPLQATADRVGKQVEEFAETLDRLSKQRPEKPERNCRHALTLVDGYQKIARNTVEYLRGFHASEKQKGLGGKSNKKIRRPASVSNLNRRQSQDFASTTAEDLASWEQEEQTWHLLGLMLQIEYPSSESKTKRTSPNKHLARPSKETDIHQYSSENEVWFHFLAHDDQAWERHTVLEWLKVCADDAGQEVEQVIQDLEETADRGSGLWAHSWLYTKEAIKGQKRLRSWPQALAPNSPGIDASLRSSDHKNSLVTQLDPDAVTRQDRGLEAQDENFEKATWLACWEMIRRGKDWNFIRAWCQERVENWRAVAMRGDPRQHSSKAAKFLPDPGIDVSWQSRVLWRKTCALAARTGVKDKYEAAVYGALSGYLPSVQTVCGSWNDYLFAHYNSYLLRSFDQYIATNLSDRLPRGLQDWDGSFEFSMTGGRRTQSGNQLIEKMRRLKTLAKEAKDPMRQLQGSLIAKTFDSFILKHGFQLLQARYQIEKKSKLPKNTMQPEAEDKKKLLIKPDDYQLIRIVTHIALIYQDLGHSWMENKYKRTTEAFIDAYIHFLGRAGKQQLLPLYASRMSPDSAVSSLSRQLPFIVEHGERRTMMELMKQYGIDVPLVLNAQLLMIMDGIGVKENRSMNDPNYPPLSILAPHGEKHNGEMRSIKDGFMGNTITDEYTAAKGLAAAKELSRRVTFSNLSRKKTKAILGREIDVSSIYGEEEDSIAGNRSAAGSHSRGYKRGGDQPVSQGQSEEERYLLWQSNSFLNLEQLLNVLTAFEEWQTAMTKKPRNDSGGRLGKQWRDEIREACEVIEANIQPLLHGWLQYSRDNKEASELERIREACLPEVLLAYIAVLNSSAQYVSRELLLKSLELGSLVASKGSDLESCFVSTGRMPELVDILAFTSTNMLLAEEYGGGKKRTSAKLSLWSTKGSLSAVT
ncbi:MAG: hypothetical protein Q9225_001003 [Loekoesia sp. 1 TL-2023]